MHQFLVCGLMTVDRTETPFSTRTCELTLIEWNWVQFGLSFELIPSVTGPECSTDPEF